MLLVTPDVPLCPSYHSILCWCPQVRLLLQMCENQLMTDVNYQVFCVHEASHKKYVLSDSKPPEFRMTCILLFLLLQKSFQIWIINWTTPLLWVREYVGCTVYPPNASLVYMYQIFKFVSVSNAKSIVYSSFFVKLQ